MRIRNTRRPATTVVECALVFPLFFLLLIGLMVGSLGVFRYQELASLARESARWASVRGYQYEQSTKNPAATPKDVYDNVVRTKAKLVHADDVKYSVTWSPDNRQGSLVTVTLTYTWIPEAFLGGITLSSTSTLYMSY